MSITFSLPSTETAWPDCSQCGGSGRWYPGSDAKRPAEDCDACDGIGPGPEESTPILNVANANGFALLRVLGYEPDHCGELNADDVLLRLSMASYRTDGETRPTVAQGNFISCGLDRSRISRYCEVLGALARLAQKRREPIIFG